MTKDKMKFQFAAQSIMQLRFSLTFKVIALVTLPLVFELACVCMLAKFANDAEKEAEQTEH
jgi:hypothetical protein